MTDELNYNNAGPPSREREVEAIDRFERLGRAGLVISIACGPMRGSFAWSVDCMCDRTGQSFDRCYAALSFAHCVEIVETEAVARGWIGRDQLVGTR
jgi:hypothetical protein